MMETEEVQNREEIQVQESFHNKEEILKEVKEILKETEEVK
jgi:mannitol/fructose-specific phosphotransferase system IIA component